MASKVIACAIVLFVQSIAAQLVGNAFAPNMLVNNLAAAETAALAGAYNSGPAPYGSVNSLPYPASALPFEAPILPIPACGFGLTLADLAGNGGGFSVTSTSPISPNGVTVQSDNLQYDGPLAVTGKMPFLGSVGLEGPLAAAGFGAVAYGCGNGEIGILNEEFPGIVANAAVGYPGSIGPNPSLAGYGLGPRGPW